MSVCGSKLGPHQAIPAITRGSCRAIWFTLRLAALGPIKAPSTKAALKPAQPRNPLHMQAGRLHFIRPVVTFFPSSYSNDPILIHTGTSPNWCQVSDFHIHHGRTSNAARARHGPEVCLPTMESREGKKKKYNYFGITCLIGIARPLPMLSVLLSRTFFSLSGSLPFRDCGAEKKSLCSIKCLFFFPLGNLKLIWQVNVGSKAAGCIYTSIQPP